MLSRSLDNTLVGTELYDRVRRLAAAEQPLGHLAVAECEEVLLGCALRAFAFGAVPGPLLHARNIRIKANELPLDAFAADHRELLDQPPPPPPPESPDQLHPVGLEVPEGSPLDESMRRQHSSSFRSPSPRRLPPSRPSAADLAAIRMSASIAFPPSPPKPAAAAAAASAEPPHVSFYVASDGAPANGQAGALADVKASVGAMAQLNVALASARWVLAVAQRLLESLSDLHYELSTSRGTWLWFAQRGSVSRFVYCLASMQLFGRPSNGPSFTEELRKRVQNVDPSARHAVALLRHLEGHITRAIGTVHAVVTGLKLASEEVRDALEMLHPSGSDEADEQLIGLAEQLDTACTSSIARMNRFFEKKCTVPSEASSSDGDRPLAGVHDASGNFVQSDAAATDTSDHFTSVKSMARNAWAWLDDTTTLNGQLAPHTVSKGATRMRAVASVFAVSGIGVLAYATQSNAARALAFQHVQARVHENFNAYVVSPALGIMEAFLVSPAQQGDAESVKRERQALEHMVVDYHRDKGWKIDPEQMAEITAAVQRGDLGRVGEDYVESMRSPILSLVRGRLARLLLIQVQQQKVNADDIVMKLNETLTQSDLTMRLFACIPVGSVLYTLKTTLSVRRRRRMLPLWADMRLCWWTLHRIMCGIHRCNGKEAATAFGDHRSPAVPDRMLSDSFTPDDVVHSFGAPPVVEPVHLHAHHSHHHHHQHHHRRSVSHEGSSNRSPLLTAATPLGHPSQPPPRIRQVRSMSTMTALSRSDDGNATQAFSRASWGSDLTPFEEGQVLLQVHAMRLLSLLLWPTKYGAQTRLRFLDDLSDLECVHASRQARLAVLDRMAVSYSFLRSAESHEV